jgi:hypothetical protein
VSHDEASYIGGERNGARAALCVAGAGDAHADADAEAVAGGWAR